MSNNAFLSEFPDPPAYFRLFTDEHALAPPKIPDGKDVQPYAGCVEKDCPQRFNGEYDDSKDYKQTLKSQATAIAESLMDLANPANRNVFRTKQPIIDNLVDEFTNTLAECRVHKARQDLIKDMEAQVKDAETLRDEMRRRIEHVKDALRQLATDENNDQVEQPMET